MDFTFAIFIDFWIYFCYGFIFIKPIKFICNTKSDSSLKDNLLSYFIVGFVIINLFKFCFGDNFFNIQNVNYIVAGIIVIGLSYLSGKFLLSSYPNKILKKMGIYRSIQYNIWENIVPIEEGAYIQIIRKDLNTVYIGHVSLIENNQRFPIISLKGYKIINFTTGEVIEDYTNNYKKCMIIYTDKADEIEITYHNGSRFIN